MIVRPQVRMYRRIPVRGGANYAPSIAVRTYPSPKKAAIRSVKALKAWAASKGIKTPVPPASRRFIFGGGGGRKPPKVVVSTSNKSSSSSLGDLMSAKMTASRARTFVEKSLEEEFSKAANKLGKKVLKGLKTKLEFKVRSPVLGEDEEEEDVKIETSTGVSVMKVGNVNHRHYKIKDRFSVVRGKYMRAQMRNKPKVTVELRNDAVGNAFLPAAATPNYNRSAVAVSGFNRKGIFMPNAFFKPEFSAQYLTKSYYPWTKGFYSHGFFVQDYNRLCYLELMHKALAGSLDVFLDKNQLDQVKIKLPIARRRLTTTITNRNAFTPAEVTIYVCQAKRLLNDTDLPHNIVVKKEDSANANIPEKFLYTQVTTPKLLDNGTVDGTETFIRESPIHLKVTPFMSDLFKEKWDVVKVRKFVLQPSDVMDYTLSVGMNGLDLAAYTNPIEGSSSEIVYSFVNGSVFSGDYQLFITFQGASRYTMGRRIWKAPVGEGQSPTFEYPPQLAVSGVVGPAEISVSSKVSMDIYQEDYYDLKARAEHRPSAWDGSNAWASAQGIANLEARLALFSEMSMVINRDYINPITGTFDSLINIDESPTPSATGAGQSGYFIQVATDTNYRALDTQSSTII